MGLCAREPGMSQTNRMQCLRWGGAEPGVPPEAAGPTLRALAALARTALRRLPFLPTLEPFPPRPALPFLVTQTGALSQLEAGVDAAVGGLRGAHRRALGLLRGR